MPSIDRAGSAASAPSRFARWSAGAALDLGERVGASGYDRAEDHIAAAARIAGEQAGPGELNHGVEGHALAARELAQAPRQVDVERVPADAELGHGQMRAESGAGEAD